MSGKNQPATPFNSIEEKRAHLREQLESEARVRANKARGGPQAFAGRDKATPREVEAKAEATEADEAAEVSDEGESEAEADGSDQGPSAEVPGSRLAESQPDIAGTDGGNGEQGGSVAGGGDSVQVVGGMGDEGAQDGTG